LNAALKLVKKAIKRQPNHAAWYRNLSTIYRDLGLKAEALAAEEHAQKLKTRIKEDRGDAKVNFDAIMP